MYCLWTSSSVIYVRPRGIEHLWRPGHFLDKEGRHDGLRSTVKILPSLYSSHFSPYATMRVFAYAAVLATGARVVQAQVGINCVGCRYPKYDDCTSSNIMTSDRRRLTQEIQVTLSSSPSSSATTTKLFRTMARMGRSLPALGGIGRTGIAGSRNAGR
jgi:hypothetical protein